MNQTDELHYDVDFREYSFNQQPGIFTYRLRKKLKNKNGRMSIFVEETNGNGGKYQITLYPDSHFLGADKISEGAVISVEFVCSRNGKVYAKRITEEK